MLSTWHYPRVALLIEILLLLMVLVGIALVAVGRGGAMREDDPDRVVTRVPPPGVPIQPEDVDGIRFGLAFRGYRMDEVDEALDRLRDEIALLRAAAARDDQPAAMPVVEPVIVEPEPEPVAPPRYTPAAAPFAPEPEPEPEPTTLSTLPTWGPASWSPPPPAAPEPLPEPEPEPEPEPLPEPEPEPEPEPLSAPEPAPYSHPITWERPATPPEAADEGDDTPPARA